MKKIVSMLLSLCMLLGVLAGCGNKEPKPEEYKYKFPNDINISLSDSKEEIIKKSGMQERSDGKGHEKEVSFVINGVPYVYMGAIFNDDDSLGILAYNTDQLENVPEACDKVIAFFTTIYGAPQEDSQPLPDQVAYWKFVTDQGQTFKLSVIAGAKAAFFSFSNLT